MSITINEFIKELSSKSPVPGGGSVSALMGTLSAALCSMAANLTSGKKKYAAYQDDIEKIIKKTNISISNLLTLIDRDAEVFLPLSEAYSIPKDRPDRDTVLENALINACSVPLDIIKEVSETVDIIEELKFKGSKLVISDVGVAASACKSALESAAMNVYINTSLMKNKKYASKINSETSGTVEKACKRCAKVYDEILNELRSVQ